MSAKAVSEYSGKELLYRHLEALHFVAKPRALKLRSADSFDVAIGQVDWLTDGQVTYFSSNKTLYFMVSVPFLFHGFMFYLLEHGRFSLFLL